MASDSPCHASSGASSTSSSSHQSKKKKLGIFSFLHPSQQSKKSNDDICNANNKKATMHKSVSSPDLPEMKRVESAVALALLILVAMPALATAEAECITSFNNFHIQGRDFGADMKEVDTAQCCEECKANDQCNCFVVDVRLRPNKCYLKKCPPEQLTDDQTFKDNLLEAKDGFRAGYIKSDSESSGGGAGGGYGGATDTDPCQLLGGKADSITDSSAQITWNKLNPDDYFLEYYEAGAKFPTQRRITGRQSDQLTNLASDKDIDVRLFHVIDPIATMNGPTCTLKFKTKSSTGSSGGGSGGSGGGSSSSSGGSGGGYGGGDSSQLTNKDT